jgi:hypothetical protein
MRFMPLVGLAVLGAGLITGCSRSAHTGSQEPPMAEMAMPAAGSTPAGHQHGAQQEPSAGQATAGSMMVGLEVTGRLAAGAPLKLHLTPKSGTGVVLQPLDLVHEKPWHLIAVRNDLGWFAHVHPQAVGDGSYLADLTFPTGGDYTLFNDLKPTGAAAGVVPLHLTIAGTAAVPNPTDTGTTQRQVGPLSITLTTPQAHVGATPLSISVTRDGVPVTNLQPYLGALGHLVVIDQSVATYIHSHPLTEGAASGGPDVAFHTEFPAPGHYRTWFQIQYDGQVLTADFPIEVSAATPGTDAGSPLHQHQHP